jgi:quercetin 2,3-dioxygenase
MDTISKVIAAKPFSFNTKNRQLFRVIGTTDIDGNGTEHELSDVDPIIFLDEAQIEGEVPETFNRHPHMGLAAISYLIKGEFRAWDNINGNAADLNRAGGVYYVDSGKGVVHGEAAAKGKRDARWLQLWINPGIYEKPRPMAHYQLFQPEDLPIHEDHGLWVKIIIGEGFNLKSPVNSGQPLQFLHIKLAPKVTKKFQLHNPKWQGFIYTLNGEGLFGVEQLRVMPRNCLVLEQDCSTMIVQNPSNDDLEFVIVRGKPHNRSFYKLLGHGGALVADSKEDLRAAMTKFESESNNFGIE